MASKKKDLEIIYNLQWKNKPANGGDKANIIGMYDIPATTLNWEIFKSYLLKNSGTVGEDVKVSYITDSNREFPIESQTDFQIALYAFRRKARLGDIVNLKLDRISDQPTHKNLRHSNDVETQFDNNEAVSLTSTCCNIETPPEWFITYMSQFKNNLTDELTTTISSIVSNIKPQVVNQPSCFHLRKSKNDCSKRIRKASTLIGESSHEPRPKELLKSLKLESKLERKLEKLEHKTKKIKEKKLPLLTKSSDSDAGQSSSRSYSYRRCETENDVLEMDAAPVSSQSKVPHMLGGEIYLHQWEVMNTGKVPWTSKTTLNFTWGSKALKPLDTVISVPYLKPGETGTLAVRLQIPDRPGQYECYWHFHHKERRFGHWLGCQIIVDPFDLKGNKSVLETSFVSEFITNSKKFKSEDVEFCADKSQARYEILQDPPTDDSRKYVFNIEPNTNNQLTSEQIATEQEEISTNKFNLESAINDMKLQDPTDTNCSSDSDNQSVSSFMSESNLSVSIPEEFVVVPIPDCFKIDQASSSENVPKQQVADNNKDLVTDSVGSNVLHLNMGLELVEDSVNNCDDNNNSEKLSQKSSGIGSPIHSLSNDESQKSDIVVISIPNKEEEDKAGCAYLIVDGHRVQIPKKILNSEYLKMGEEAAGSSKENLTKTSAATSSTSIGKQSDSEIVVNAQEAISVSVADSQVNAVDFRSQKIELDANSDLMSHCSAAGSCFSEAGSTSDKNSRLFIFPQNCPGFEVVYPTSIPVQPTAQEYNWSDSDTRYAFPVPTEPATTAASAPPLNLSTHDRNPFATGTDFHIPNYQQTPPDMRTPPPATAFTSTTDAANVPIIHATTGTPPVSVAAAVTENVRVSEATAPIHILPETLVSGAVNVASSAINTARSVINMIVPREQPGRWVNGHWVSSSTETPREANLQALAEMGFWNRDLNATLLARYNDDLSRVVAELVQ